jgi:hypothetical protein
MLTLSILVIATVLLFTQGAPVEPNKPPKLEIKIRCPDIMVEPMWGCDLTWETDENGCKVHPIFDCPDVIPPEPPRPTLPPHARPCPRVMVEPMLGCTLKWKPGKNGCEEPDYDCTQKDPNPAPPLPPKPPCPEIAVEPKWGCDLTWETDENGCKVHPIFDCPDVTPTPPPLITLPPHARPKRDSPPKGPCPQVMVEPMPGCKLNWEIDEHGCKHPDFDCSQPEDTRPNPPKPPCPEVMVEPMKGCTLDWTTDENGCKHPDFKCDKE